MFGKKEETTQTFSMQVINNIGQGTNIEGHIKTDGDIRIDGKVNGNVMTKGRLVLGPTSEVIGDIMCMNGNIDGFVRGNIQVSDVLKITKTANIDGNITVKKLIVEEGAIIQAKVAMTNNATNSVNRPNNIAPSAKS